MGRIVLMPCAWNHLYFTCDHYKHFLTLHFVFVFFFFFLFYLILKLVLRQFFCSYYGQMPVFLMRSVWGWHTMMIVPIFFFTNGFPFNLIENSVRDDELQIAYFVYSVLYYFSLVFEVSRAQSLWNYRRKYAEYFRDF